MSDQDAAQHNAIQTTPTATADARIRQVVNRIAGCDLPVMIVGEGGTGKRSLAAQIHDLSRRSLGPFCDLACGDLTARALLNALSMRGTVYLSGISALSPAIQELLVSRLLVPSELPMARMIFGSEHEPAEDVRTLKLREDFFYLASMVTIRIPPLRYRKQEILALSETLLMRYSRQFERPVPALSPEIIRFLMEHHWAGNITELQKAIKTLVAIGDQAISLAALRASRPSIARANGNHNSLTLKEAARRASTRIEREMIADVLNSNGGNRKRAACQLGISYKALLYKIKQEEAGHPSPAAKRSEMQK
jgi:transcriptional regulator with PAS, ATPase and Fis domain